MSTLTVLSLMVTIEQLPAKKFSYAHCVQASVSYCLNASAKSPQ